MLTTTKLLLICNSLNSFKVGIALKDALIQWLNKAPKGAIQLQIALNIFILVP